MWTKKVQLCSLWSECLVLGICFLFILIQFVNLCLYPENCWKFEYWCDCGMFFSPKTHFSFANNFWTLWKVFFVLQLPSSHSISLGLLSCLFCYQPSLQFIHRQPECTKVLSVFLLLCLLLAEFICAISDCPW